MPVLNKKFLNKKTKQNKKKAKIAETTYRHKHKMMINAFRYCGRKG